jgi:hypothetical protein
MARRNPLREEDEIPREVRTGDTIINTRTQSITQLVDAQGNVRQFVTKVTDSRPDDAGGFTDSELIRVPFDSAGNPLPEDPRKVRISHSGLYIGPEDKQAICTSWLHPPGRSRNILVGQDGHELPGGGAICSSCRFWLTTIYLGIGILALGLIIGLFKGAGWF